jgi:diguanylate cyclase (GGDEF)-like protein/PAS domain S-box-containing protein
VTQQYLLNLLKNLNNEFSEVFFNSLNDGIYLLDHDRRITFWNKGAERITGYSAAEVIGRKCSDNLLTHIDERGLSLCKDFCPAEQTLRDGNIRHLEVYLHHKEGYRLPVVVHTLPIRNKDGFAVGVVELFSDMSPKVSVPQKIEDLERMALLDPQTEIPNRQFLEMHLHSRLEEMQKYNLPFGVLFIDIDNFHKVNEIYSREVGDRILRVVAKTLFSNIRFFDVVGRWDREEFLVVILNINESKMDVVANKLRLLVAQSTITVETDFVSTTVSIGATLAQWKDTVETLVKRAEQLMLHSKWLGRNRVSLRLGEKEKQ